MIMSIDKKSEKVKMSERRMAENEVVFRSMNEQVEKDFNKIAKIAKSAGLKEDEYPAQDDTPLHFHCECYDENCEERIIMKPSKYAEIHKKRDRFTVVANHIYLEIEKVTYKSNAYWIVDKKFAVNQKKKTLQPTPKSVS